MKSETIYNALRVSYHRGELEGEDLAEFIGMKRMKSMGIKVEYALKYKYVLAYKSEDK